MVARRAHNPKVVGSNPAPATKFKKPSLMRRFFFVLLQVLALSGVAACDTLSDMAWIRSVLPSHTYSLNSTHTANHKSRKKTSGP